jgi:epoxyqueuosine reductase
MPPAGVARDAVSSQDGISSAEVKAKAADLGFDLCGIAPAEDFPELAFLREWLAKGYAANMTWLNRTVRVRSDVRQIMPAAQSVIVTGTLYNTDRPYSGEAPPGVAGLARYAWGEDYHAVIGGRLDALIAWMRASLPSPEAASSSATSSSTFEARPYVDTGPVQERVYAQYGGLGWIGKNTCLINPDLGSWLFLAVIITTLSLVADAQGLEQCGSCTRCLDACPTGALVQPGVLDSNRCISYLTIEHKSAIPGALRPAMGAHVYGCDICQEVCPYNQPAPRSGESAWLPRAPLDGPTLGDLWRRSDAEMSQVLAGSAMARAPLTNLRRNIAIAIGNVGDDDAHAALNEESLDRPSADDPVVREHVRWALRRRADEGLGR